MFNREGCFYQCFFFFENKGSENFGSLEAEHVFSYTIVHQLRLLHYSLISDDFCLVFTFQRRRFITQGNAKSKSEKFPPPHQDGSVGFQLDTSHNGPISFGPSETSFASSIFGAKKDRDRGVPQSGPLGNPSAAAGEPFWRMKAGKEEHHMAPSRTFIRTFKPSSIGISMDLRRKGKSSRRAKGKEAVSEVFGGGSSMLM